MLDGMGELVGMRAAGGATDADLLAAVGGGDRGEPLQELYRRYAGRIFGLGVQLLGDRGLAEELVQETFVRVWRNAARYDPDRGAPATFVFTVARRVAVDLWRRPSSRPVPDHSEAPVDDDPIDRLMTNLQVRDALDALAPPHREVLELSYRGDLRQSEIAERLGIPLGTVKTRSFHALRSLRAALAERGVYD
jgi:RNA polymerase sigma-70 factor (ECF subfamily)